MAQIPEIFVALIEVVGEVDAEAAAAGALIDVSGEELIAGAADLLTSTGADGKLILQPIFEDVTLASEDIVGRAELGTVTKGQLHALWQDSKTFARWTGREIMKGALFEAGMQAIEAILHKNAPPGHDTVELEHIIGVVNSSLATLTRITNEWRKWCVKQFGHRDDYGAIRIEDSVLLRFEVFRNNLGELGLYVQKNLVPLFEQLHKNIDTANLGELKAAMKTYADMVLATSARIQQKEFLMVHAGLKDHKDDVQKARDMLN